MRVLDHQVPNLESTRLEAAHQRERWGEAHDRAKTPADWFWFVGYLPGKANAAHQAGNVEKALDHTISSAAALRHWHAAIRWEAEHGRATGLSDIEKQHASEFQDVVLGDRVWLARTAPKLVKSLRDTEKVIQQYARGERWDPDFGEVGEAALAAIVEAKSDA